MTQNDSAADHKKVEQTPLVLIGASVGGPQALGEILPRLRAPLPFAVVIAQHLECNFMGDFVSWLSRHSKLDCVLARAHEKPQAGQVYLASCEGHLVFDRTGRFLYAQDDPDNPSPYKPEIDQLFCSAATHWPEAGVALLLTGMGSDGAKGLLQLRQKGWVTAAQDEESSVVYGMPKAAAQMDAAQKILPAEAMAGFITCSWAELHGSAE